MKVIIVFPVHNESQIIQVALQTAFDSLPKLSDINWQIVVVENGSTDNTYELANNCSISRYINVIKHDIPSKGLAIKKAWESFEADVYCFSDIDQSINLSNALPKIVESINAGNDIVTFVRVVSKESGRPLYRRILSSVYHLVAQIIVKTKLKDLPVGLKAVTKHSRDILLPKIKNTDWFFDSELLLRAEELGMKIDEIHSPWVETRFKKRTNRLPITKVSKEYLKALLSFKKL